MLIVGTAREELFDERPGLTAARNPAGAPRRPLPRPSSSPSVTRSGSEDAERVVARADGNPLFLEQLGAAFAEGGESMPPDIAGLIAARLDRLDAQARGALEAAAIVGREFWSGALTSLLDREEDVGALPASLERLTQESSWAAAPRTRSRARRASRACSAEGACISGTRSCTTPCSRRCRRRAARSCTSASPHARASYADHEPAVVGYHLEQAARLRMELRPRDAPPAAAGAAAAELEQAGRQALERDDAPAAGLLLEPREGAAARSPRPRPRASRRASSARRAPRSFAAARRSSARVTSSAGS